jgi:outer membrane protein assembly factor BamB
VIGASLAFLLLATAAGSDAANEDAVAAPSPAPVIAREVRFDGPPSHPPPPGLYPGAFREAPVRQWSRPLPGRKVNAATHAETSRPVVRGERVYLGAAGSTALYALHRRDGSLLATYEAVGVVRSEPLIEGERLWFTDGAGATTCYRLTGERVWQHLGPSAIPSPPAPAGDLLLIRNVDDVVYALDRETGATRWQYRRPANATRTSELTLFAAPEPTVAGPVAVVGFSDGSVVALEHASGDLLWELQVGAGQYPDMVAPVAVFDTMILAAGYGGPLLAIDVRDGAVRWRADVGAASAGILLETAEGNPIFVHPGTDGSLRAFDPRDGTVLWTWQSGRGGALTTPVLTEAGLVVGSSLGVLAIVDPLRGTTAWRWHEDRRLQGISVAPAVEGRQLLVVSNAGRIYAMLSPREPSAAPHETRPTHKFELAYPRDDAPARDR